MFYTFEQNNAGGSFIINDDLNEYVIIEAKSYDAAIEIADNIGMDFSDGCPCCGSRWSLYPEDGTDEPLIYGILASGYNDYFGTDGGAVVHYADGTKKVYTNDE